jgi:hypothetical protein
MATLFGGEMKKSTLLWILGLCFVAAGVCFAASHQAHMGTWKLNEEKSKLSGPVKNTMVKYEAKGDEVKVTVDGVDADGKPTHNEWVGKFDEKFYPVKGDPTSDMRSYKIVDDHTLGIMIKNQGEVRGTGTITVSDDGKTRTVKTSVRNAKGDLVANEGVYDKQ